MSGRQGRRRKQLLDDLKGKERILEIKKEITRSQSVDDSLSKNVWSFRKIVYGMNERTNERILCKVN